MQKKTKETAPSGREVIRTLAGSIREFKGASVATPIIVTGEVVMEVAIPFVTAQLINSIQAGASLSEMLPYAGVLVAMALASLTFGIEAGITCSQASCGLAMNLRHDVFAAVQRFSFANIDQFSSSSLVTRLTTDVTVIQNALVSGTRPLVRGPVILVMGLVCAAFMSAELAVVFFVVLPVLAVATFSVVRRVGPLYRVLQGVMDQLNDALQEDLAAIRVIKAYVREGHVADRFARVNGLLASTGARTFRTAVLNVPIFQATMYVTCVGDPLVRRADDHGGVAHRGHLHRLHELRAADRELAHDDLQRLPAARPRRHERGARERGPRRASHDPLARGRGARGPGRIGGLRPRELQVRAGRGEERAGGRVPAPRAGLDGGGARRDGLGQDHARAARGATVRRELGHVSVGGHDVRDYDLAALRDAVGVVLQKNVLFSGTVRENLAWGDAGATDEQMLEACRLACADEFLDRIGGLDGDLGQGGAGVSGGQKQRLCIARTLLKHPRVLIFDDSTSAVDMATRRHDPRQPRDAHRRDEDRDRAARGLRHGRRQDRGARRGARPRAGHPR